MCDVSAVRPDASSCRTPPPAVAGSDRSRRPRRSCRRARARRHHRTHAGAGRDQHRQRASRPQGNDLAGELKPDRVRAPTVRMRAQSRRERLACATPRALHAWPPACRTAIPGASRPRGAGSHRRPGDGQALAEPVLQARAGQPGDRRNPPVLERQEACTAPLPVARWPRCPFHYQPLSASVRSPWPPAPPLPTVQAAIPLPAAVLHASAQPPPTIQGAHDHDQHPDRRPSGPRCDPR